MALAGCGAGDDPIVIGIAGPFGQARGASMLRAAELAVKEVNAAGGLRGRSVELLALDDSANNDVAVRVAQRFYDDRRVVAVVGHLTSGTTLAAAPIYGGGRLPLPVISPSASSPELSDAGPSVFRICPDDLAHGEALAALARDRLLARRVAILFHDDAYGRGIRASFSRVFLRLGGTVVSDDPFLPSIPTFEPYLERLRRRGGADVIMVAGTREVAVRILATLDSLGITTPVIGGDALTGIEAAAGGREVYVSASYLADRPSDRNAAFLAAYREVSSDPPDHRGAGSYDIIHLLARAIAEAGPNRSAIQRYLTGVGTRSPAYDGVTGTIAFDEQGDVPEKQVWIGAVRDGRLVSARP